MGYKDPEQRRAYARNWMRKRREEWFQVNGPCVDCGSWEDLQLDHKDARLKIAHRVWSWSAERRETELAKCVARCLPCHKLKTTIAGERARGEKHGSVRLTEEKVREIRRLHAYDKISTRELARIYDVSQATIAAIVIGKTWKCAALAQR